MVTFLIFSLLSGIIEMGPIFWEMQQDFSLVKVLLFPCMYQLGNLFTGFAVLSHGKTRFLIPAIGIISWWVGFMRWMPAVYLTVLCISFCLNTARNRCKDNCPVWLKRICRIGGFIVSPVMAVCPWFCLAISSVLPLFVYFRTEASLMGKIQEQEPDKLLGTVMVFHQMHYFVYTYIIPILLVGILGNTWYASIAFGISWIVYLTPQTVAGRFGNKHPRILFFVCHTFLLLTLIGMMIGLHSHITLLFLFAWLLTGLGGGSVFCIPRLGNRQKPQKLVASENLGHFLGSASAVIISSLFPTQCENWLVGMSSLFVLLTLGCGVVYILRRIRS